METSYDDIAIIGMVCRFPGADHPEEFWQLICHGSETVTFFSDAELQASGVELATFQGSHYVKAGQIIKNAEWFDAAFFGFTPSEAEIIDPQQRMFLECAWAALEDAGYDPNKYAGQIGVYAGATSSNYLLNVYTNQEVVQTMGYFQISLSTEKDHLPMRVSYKLNLRGPSINVQTACSTSLVAVHLACEGLLNRQCDMALAGAVTLRMPQGNGYEYEPGGVAAIDGHCSPFAAEATGTVFGNGIGIVVLKRLENALADGDHISAVIKSSAINNDGSLKIGYSAPSVEGQTAVITEALALADVAPESIGYVEAHGTGTPLGDPIEIAALTRAFRSSTDKQGFCALGAIKANIGHLETASGMAGLIKTVLALKHKEIPPQINFAAPNPVIDFANSPFYVNTSLRNWPQGATPRRAGVSSFGMGGTNAHVILEEAPQAPSSSSSRPYQLLLFSARSAASLEAVRSNLASYLCAHSESNIADVAFTLQVGRCAFPHRNMLVCADLDDAVRALTEPHSDRIFKSTVLEERRPLAFMFPGQGSQYVNMAHDLYRTESLFRGIVDYCTRFLKPHVGLDLGAILYPDTGKEIEAERQLGRTALTQPALFIIEYALARLWLSWGLIPQAFIGHSIGEYVAACLAGVFSLEDALTLVAARGRLIQQLPEGAMLSVPLSVEDVVPYLNSQLSLAAINSPTLTVVSGPLEAIATLEEALRAQNQEYRRLHTSHAFHSNMLEPVLAEFKTSLQRIKFRAPKIPYLSNVTGTWITERDVLTPDYWVRQLRQTVLFAAGIETLIKNSSYVLLEVGPGQTLSTFARSQQEKAKALTIVASLRRSRETLSDMHVLLTALGKLWLASMQIDWKAFYAHEQRQRVSLPTYPFERQPYYLELLVGNATNRHRQDAPYLYSLAWKRVSTLRLTIKQQAAADKRFWVIFTDKGELSAQIINQLTSLNHSVTIVEQGAEFAKRGENIYTLNPAVHTDYQALSQQINIDKGQALGMIYCWETSLPMPSVDVFLGQMVADLQQEQPVPIWVIGENNLPVESSDSAVLSKSLILYDCIRLAQQPNLLCRYLDIVLAQAASVYNLLLEQLMSQFLCEHSPGIIALRGNYCWECSLVQIDQIATSSISSMPVRGNCLIDNLSHKNASAITDYLAQFPKTRLAILVENFTLPSVGSGDLRWLSMRWDNPASEDNETLLCTPQETALLNEQQEELFVRILQVDQHALEGPLIVSLKRPLNTLFDCHFEPADALLAAKRTENVSRNTFSQDDRLVEFVAPRAETEQTLASIWQHLLGIKQVSVFDNFFDLGGHSLLATQILARVRETFKIELALRDVFEAPTIAEFALLLERKDLKQHRSILPELKKETYPEVIPASFAQGRLWFFDQLETHSSVYNIPTAVRLKGPLQHAILKKALDEIVRRHEVLRTTFTFVDNQVAQVIQNEYSVTIDQVDISAIVPAVLDDYIKELVLAEGHKPFDLKTGPLLRVTLLTRASEEHIVVLTFHHIIFDAWSLGILMQELAVLYEAFDQGLPSPLAALPLQYADVAIWQRRLQGPALEILVAYWREQLAGLQPYLDLPLDHPRPPTQTFRGTIRSFAVPERITAHLIDFSHREEKTLFVCLLAAFNVLLFYSTKQEDINVGTAVANRTHVAMEKLIGFFVDTIPLRTRLTANLTFLELVERVDVVVKGAQAHQGIPFEYLVEALEIERNPAYNPLFQTAFVMQNTPLPRFSLNQLTLQPLQFDISTGSARFDLLLDIGEVEKRLIGSFEYNTDLFDERTIMHMIDLFQLLLSVVVANSEATLLELVDMLTKHSEELHRIKKGVVKQKRLEQLKQIKRRPIVLDEK